MPEELEHNPEQDLESEDSRMSFWDHLAELRSCLVHSMAAILVLFIGAYYFAEDLLAFIKIPFDQAMPEGTKMIATAPVEMFWAYIKLAFVAAVVAGSPYIFYQLWRFISPGLYPRERRLAVPFLLLASGLFLGGTVFCFTLAFPFALNFLLGMATEDVVPMIKISEYLSFSLSLLMIFGLVFETPLLLIFLAKLGIINSGMLRKQRRYAVLGIFIVAAVVSPTPDAFNQTMLAIPLYLLYEASIYIISRLEKRKKARELAEDQG